VINLCSFLRRLEPCSAINNERAGDVAVADTRITLRYTAIDLMVATFSFLGFNSFCGIASTQSR